MSVILQRHERLSLQSTQGSLCLLSDAVRHLSHHEPTRCSDKFLCRARYKQLLSFFRHAAAKLLAADGLLARHVCRKQTFLEAIDFAEVASYKDAKLLSDAKYGALKGGRMSKEQAGCAPPAVVY